MQRYLCVHAHFYQPPRENPWLEEVELQESASPFHDWNERITAECYAPNTASRILDQERRIVDLVNNYSKISFNFGPTLLSWMERHKPDIYEQILEADKMSQERFSGHGSALAQVYNHMIMPLANTRDKYTQILWGIRDFQLRFNRFPEGMWLPETAVDTETLEILAEQGIVFTLLSPYQARRIRPMGSEEWQDASGGNIDPTRPYLCRLPSGRSICLFFYDGPISQDIAFGGLLESGEAMADRFMNAFSEERDWPQLAHVATDGETYGHHHWMGDMALAYCLYHVEQNELAEITIYGEYLEKHPPEWEAEIVEQSSWSCVHGVERWKNDCGCNSGLHPGWRQQWRKPLRDGLDAIRDELAPLYEQEAGRLVSDPWSTREEYIEVILDRSVENVDAFLARQSFRRLSDSEKVRLLKLLEIQRQLMLMYTSCGWFFDEISGIETTQIMSYAARAVQLAEEIFEVQLEELFLKHLEQAKSNVKALRNGREVYDKFVKPASLDFFFVSSHYALSSLFEEQLENISIYCYTAENEAYEQVQAGNMKLGIGRTRIVSNITWDEILVSFAAAYLGDHNANCGIRSFRNEEGFSEMQQEIKRVFLRGDLPELIRTMDKHFESHRYTLWHLFKDEQHKVLQDILQTSLDDVESSFRQILDQHYTFINFLKEVRAPVPKALAVTAETMIDSDLQRIFEQEGAKLDVEELKRLLDLASGWEVPLSTSELGYKACWKIDALMERLSESPDDLDLLATIETALGILLPAGLELNLWKTQNLFFFLAKEHLQPMQEKAEAGDSHAAAWAERLCKLGDQLRIRVQ